MCLFPTDEMLVMVQWNKNSWNLRFSFTKSKKQDKQVGVILIWNIYMHMYIVSAGTKFLGVIDDPLQGSR